MPRRTIALISTVSAAIVLSLGMTAAQAAPTIRNSPSGATQTTGHMKYLGTTRPALLASAPSAPTARGRAAATPLMSLSPLALSQSGGAAQSALQPPTVSGTPISPTAGGVKVFNGVNALQQTNAGTGIYAGTQAAMIDLPNPTMCAGNGYVVEGVNLAFAVHDTSGNPLTAPTAYNQFFNVGPVIESQGPPLVIGTFTSNPQCAYDPVGRRFVQTITEIDHPGLPGGPNSRTHLLIAVSVTDNPAGEWNLFSIDTTDNGTDGTPSHDGCPCFQVGHLYIGVNADGFYISTDEVRLPFPGLDNGAQIYAFGRRSLESATSGSDPSFVQLNTSTSSTGDPNLPIFAGVEPANTPATPRHNVEFFVSDGPQAANRLMQNPPLDNRLAVWALTGTGTLDSASPALALHQQVVTSEVYGNPARIPVAQKPGPTPLRDALGDINPIANLDSGESLLSQVTQVGDTLYATINTALTAPDGSQRVGIAWFVVHASSSHDGTLSASIANQGYLATDNDTVFMPAVAVDSYGNGALAFTVSGPDFFPSLGFVRFDGDGPHGPIHIAASGTGPMDGVSGYPRAGGQGRAQWSASTETVDNLGNVFIGGEYIPGPRESLANWGFALGKVPTEG